MWGNDIGESFGAGGLGLSGIGEGGGGRGEGIGLGGIGTLGHGAGTGTGQGFGSGHGRLGGSHRAKPPQVRMGATQVSGRLPPEVIQRIVRQNFGRFRLCYENGLRNNPNLQGRVSVRFVIGRDGAVSQRRQRRLGHAGRRRGLLRGARLLRPVVPAARGRHRHGHLPHHVQPRRLNVSSPLSRTGAREGRETPCAALRVRRLAFVRLGQRVDDRPRTDLREGALPVEVARAGGSAWTCRVAPPILAAPRKPRARLVAGSTLKLGVLRAHLQWTAGGDPRRSSADRASRRWTSERLRTADLRGATIAQPISTRLTPGHRRARRASRRAPTER